MLNKRKLPRFLWAEAVNAAVYLLNRVTVVDKKLAKTAYEIWYGRKPDLGYVKIYGSLAYAKIPKQLRKKFDNTGKMLVLVGYEGDSANYRLYCPATKTVKVYRHVEFNDNAYISKVLKQTEGGDMLIFSADDNDIVNQYAEEAEQALRDDVTGRSEEAPVVAKVENVSPPHQRMLRDRAHIKQSARYQGNIAEINVPTSYREAVECQESAQW